ncbi:ras-associating and dilute domain-containing protein-like [Paramormyrops kingsleyae]|uniref:ras-associating and dilute domain-containing protein-like n=1 Tax=Paramormyrops kingsleyae TaxID=1676925 RepID=UPI003B96E572
MLHSRPVAMALPLKAQPRRSGRVLTQVLCRTLSQKERRPPAATPPECPGEAAELSIQTSAPGVLRIFGDAICAGAHYKSVLATPSSSARELVREALQRYALAGAPDGDYVLCDVVGELSGPAGRWRTEGVRVLRDDERPLLLQDLWRPKEGLARRLELRRRANVEELSSREQDTITAGINAQARRLQRTRAKGTPGLGRSLSETSLDVTGGSGGEARRSCLTLPRPLKEAPQKRDDGEVRLSLYQSPHLLLLQGYSRQDRLVYLLNRDQHTVGQETASARPNICLLSTDILPLHCTIRRAQSGHCLVLEPAPHAAVLVNFTAVEKSTALQHGDLLSFGSHYIFLYKDPVGGGMLPTRTLLGLRPRRPPPEPEGAACRVCGAPSRSRPSVRGRHASEPDPAPGRDPQRRRVLLAFEKGQEDRLLGRIISLTEPGGDEHKLTPAYLLCMCLEHSAMTFDPGRFGKLLLKIAKRIQDVVQEKTRELSGRPPQHQELPAGLSDLVPCLQPLLFWMSNAIEILHFSRQKSATYAKCGEQSDTRDAKESVFNVAVLASEDGVTALEEVIMSAFQQCVYHMTKSLYESLMGLLDSAPPQKDRRAPESLLRTLQMFQAAQALLQRSEIHPEIQSQMLAYLFFFSNVALFNQLMDNGPARGWFRLSSGLQLKASLRTLLDWTKRAGLSRLAETFFSKFHCAVGIMATPPQELAQMSWRSLCVTYPALKPVQLHHILTQCLLVAESRPSAVWQPTAEEEVPPYRTADLLESFEEPPPIVLPSGGYQVALDSDAVDDSIYRQLLYLRHFLWGLRTKSPCIPARGEPQGNGAPSLGYQGPATPQAEERPKSKASMGGQGTAPRGLQIAGVRLRDDQQVAQPPNASCLLTPPTTPNYPDTERRPGGPAPPSTKRNDGLAASEIEVHLDKGALGLGLGLIDGLQTPLQAPGIYIRTLVPGGPASSDGRLRIGDRILAVNGTDVTGSDYQSAVDLIRWGGRRLNLLVEKMDPEVSSMIRASLC